MTRTGKSLTVALALSWDGSRVPLRDLPAAARVFLGVAARKPPTAGEMSRLFTENAVTELRICWVPRLAGGGENLSDSFSTSDGKRRAFVPIKTKKLDGDCYGIIYRLPTARS